MEAGIALAKRSWLASAPNEDHVPHYKFFPCQIEGDAAFVFVDDDGEHCVRLYHVGTTRQQELSWHTVALRRAADDIGGRYDGWETLVVKPAATASKKK